MIAQEGVRVCTDVRMPNHVLSLECPATCAKANGALLLEQRPTDDPCFETCADQPETCQEWLNMTYTVGGCASKCTTELKLLYRPDVACEHAVVIGDSVVVKSGSPGCVESVLSPSAIVNVGDESQTVKVADLLLAGTAYEECVAQEPVEAAILNSLQAVINGPTRVSAKSCDPVTLDAYQSTNYGPTSALTYLWKVPVALRGDELDVSTPLLSFKYLEPKRYVFGLTVSNGTHHAKAADFKMVVVPDFVPVVTLACPKSVCAHTATAEYEIKVSLNEQIMLMLDVKLATECDSLSRMQNGGMLFPIDWTQLQRRTWQPQQVGFPARTYLVS